MNISNILGEFGSGKSVVWNWIAKNEQWLFSGAGITALAVIWWLLRKIVSAGAAASPNSAVGQPQVNINVSPTISANQSNTQSTVAAKHDVRSAPQPGPEIKALTYKAVFARGIGSAGANCFIMSFRNDGWTDATNVIAHIGYTGPDGQKLLVDYGGWIEHQPVMDIGRGHTKNLIIALTDRGKNFAVTDIGPATNYTQFRLVEVGEITPGAWKMTVTLSADNFREDYPFELAIGQDGSLLCQPEGTTLAIKKQEKKEPAEAPKPNVGSLRPEVVTVGYDEDSDIWTRGSAGGGFQAALLPFSNEAQPPKKIAPLEHVRARLTYYEKDRVGEFKRVDSGCWVGEAYRYGRLRVGDIAYLIAAIQIDGHGGIITNPRYSSKRYSEDHTAIDDLPEGQYEVKVDLVAGEHGEYAETYWFELEVSDRLKTRRLNQRPAYLG